MLITYKRYFALIAKWTFGHICLLFCRISQSKDGNRRDERVLPT